MKKVKLLTVMLFMTLTTVSFGQKDTSEIVELDSSFSKETLYSNALSFFANTFNSANSVIQMQDPVSGKIIGKGIVDKRDVTITISCKEGKYKYEIIAEDQLTEITLKVNRLGNPSANAGVTKGKIIIVVNVPTLDTNSIYFKYNNTLWSNYTYYFNNNDHRHSPAIGTKAYYNDWKEDVRKEIMELKSVYEERTKNDVAITFLVGELKKSMQESEW